MIMFQSLDIRGERWRGEGCEKDRRKEEAGGGRRME